MEVATRLTPNRLRYVVCSYIRLRLEQRCTQHGEKKGIDVFLEFGEKQESWITFPQNHYDDVTCSSSKLRAIAVLSE